MTLYELTGEYLALLQMMESGEEDAIRDTLEGISGEIEDKAEGYGKIIRTLEADAAALKAEAEKLTERRRTIENNIARMKERLQLCMIATGQKKINAGLFTFALAKNPPKLVVDEDAEIPFDFYIPQPAKLDTAALKAAIKGGEEYHGARLIQEESLRIK